MNYTLRKLSNGVRILEVPVSGASSVTALVLFGVGSRYEVERTNGLSHFLEHMFFKGSKKRPTAAQISETVDAVGGEMNAFTSKEYTGYYIKVASQHGLLALDVLSDMLKNPLFDAEELDRERGVIIEEIGMYEDQPIVYVGELFEEKMFADSPLGWKVIGTRENIRKLEREDFVKHKEAFYSAENTLVVLAGNLQPIEGKTDAFFSDWKEASTEAPEAYITKPATDRFVMHQKNTEQTHVWLGFKTVAANHPDRFALKIIAAILGGGMSSRLFTQVRERRGLAYYVRASVEHYLDTGYLVASAGVNPEKFPEATTTILHELQRLVDEPVEEKELRKAKEYLKGKIQLYVEQSDNLAEVLGMQELLQGEILTPEELGKRYDAVTSADITRVMKTYYKPNELYASVISSKDYTDWLKQHIG